MTTPQHDERHDFEAWYCADALRQGLPMPEGIAHLRDGDGYGEHRVMLNGKWEGWQARAALLAEAAELRAALVGCLDAGREIADVAYKVDGWQSFPPEPIEKMEAAITQAQKVLG